MLNAMRDFMDHFVDQTENTLCVFACVIPITALATELIVRVAGLLCLMLTAVLTGILRDGVLIILPALHIAIIPVMRTEAGGHSLRRQLFTTFRTFDNKHIAAFGFTGAFDFVCLCACIRRIIQMRLKWSGLMRKIMT